MSELEKLFGKKHPFISEPGEWYTVGHGVKGADLSRFPLEGRTNVFHEEGKIVVEGFLSTVEMEPLSFQSRYQLTPTGNDNLLAFRQEGEAVGNLAGELLGLDDRLVTSFASGDGTLNGAEVLHKMGDNRYTATGFIAKEGSFISVWKVDLVRKAGA